MAAVAADLMAPVTGQEDYIPGSEDSDTEKAESQRLRAPENFINRELSWLAFNRRVLEEAQDMSNPLLERIRFLTICESNLDEFYMVRVANVKTKIASGITTPSVDGREPEIQLDHITAAAREYYEAIYRTWNEEIYPSLRLTGISILEYNELSMDERLKTEAYYTAEVFPILTPIAINPGNPFPRLSNRSLNLGVILLNQRTHKSALAVIQMPSVLPRFFRVASGKPSRYIALENIVKAHLESLFSGFEIGDVFPFKITRDSDLVIEAEEVDDLLATIQQELRRREKGSTVRLELHPGISPASLEMLLEELELTETDVFYCDGPLPLASLRELMDDPLLKSQGYKPFTPILPFEYDEPEELFQEIRKKDIFVHHPFHSFAITEDFLEAAARDSKVLGIKITLYRTGRESRILNSLIKAARAGKSVTALVELKARFDEETNIQWAMRLEEEGIHVVYGIVDLKTHCKVALVVRKEQNKIRRYVHLSTGNYNAITSRIYTDLALFTCDEDIASDVQHIFNSITGFSNLPKLSKIHTSPVLMKKHVIRLIRAERDNARKGLKSHIIAKMNSLVDPDVIVELYKASSAGVRIELIVRGICCLRPGIPGVSENITVRSIVGRLLEHSRAFYFENNGKPQIFISSADWMQRNFLTRIEMMIPIESPGPKEMLIREFFPLYLSGNQKTRFLQPNGIYTRPSLAPDEPRINVQETFLAKAALELSERQKKTRKKNPLRQKTSKGRRKVSPADR